MPDVKWLVPPGKFEVKFQKTTMTLHGKSSDFNVAYADVLRVFYVPTLRTDACLVLHVSQDLRHGSTSSSFLVMSLDSNVHTPHTVRINAGNIQMPRRDPNDPTQKRIIYEPATPEQIE